MAAPATALTWTPQTIDSIGSVGGYTSLVIDDDGLAHISYYDFTNGDLKYATGSGTTWVCQTVDSVGDVGQYTSLALNNAGYPHISYYDATKSDLKYAAWNGTSWNIQTVDSTGGVGQYTSLALNSAGNPSISYYDTTNTNLKFASFNGIMWVNETVDSPGSVGSYTSLRLNKTGYPCISYYDSTHTDLKYAEWNGGSWIIRTVDGPQQVGQYSALSLNRFDYPAIDYYDTTNGDLKYAAWNGNSWVNETIMSSGNVGTYTSLVFDSADHPRITFYDVTNADLKYAAWNGTTWTTETPDSAGLTGYYSQLALDEDDFPHISYYDVTNGDLKFVLVYHPLIPGFSGTPLSGTGPLTVAFVDTIGLVTGALALLVVVGACCAGLAYIGAQNQATPTPAPTPTVAALFSDNFANPQSGWNEMSSDQAVTRYANGGYVIQVKKDNWLAWSTPAQNFSNIQLGVTASGVAKSPDIFFGLLCDFVDNDNFYYAGLGSGGEFAIIRFSKGIHTFINSAGKAAPSDRVTPGKASYQLGLACGHNSITLSADGHALETVAAPELGSGDVGLFVWTTDLPGGETREVRFENLVVTALP